MISFITLFLVGIGVGCFGALVGLGGGLIMVPLFMLTMMLLTEPRLKPCSRSSARASSVCC